MREVEVKTFAVVNSDGEVVSCILLCEEDEYEVTEGHELIESDEAGPGWTYADGEFTPPEIDSVTEPEM